MTTDRQKKLILAPPATHEVLCFLVNNDFSFKESVTLLYCAA